MFCLLVSEQIRRCDLGDGWMYQAEADGASEAKVLGVALYFGVGEEESHGDQGPDDHGAASAPEVLGATHEASQDGTGNGAQVGDGVVAPNLAVGETTKFSATSTDIDGEEDVVERVSKSDEKLWSLLVSLFFLEHFQSTLRSRYSPN